VILLTFSLGYVAWRWYHPAKDEPGEKPFPRTAAILVFALLMTIVTYLVRIWFNYGVSASFFSLKLSHLTFYLAFFILGAAALPLGWVFNISEQTTRRWGWLAVAIGAIFPIIFFIFRPAAGEATPLLGGLNLGSLVFVAWEVLLCISVNLGLLGFFRHYYNHQSGLAKALSDNAYAIYLIHIPVIAVCRQLLYDLPLLPLVKLLLTTVISFSACFLISHYLLRRIPGVNRILFTPG
jgi:surface polysaccharide O-acyltransferase-like enzyme